MLTQAHFDASSHATFCKSLRAALQTLSMSTKRFHFAGSQYVVTEHVHWTPLYAEQCSCFPPRLFATGAAARTSSPSAASGARARTTAPANANVCELGFRLLRAVAVELLSVRAPLQPRQQAVPKCRLGHLLPVAPWHQHAAAAHHCHLCPDLLRARPSRRRSCVIHCRPNCVNHRHLLHLQQTLPASAVSCSAIWYLRALQGHSGRSLIDPSLQDNVLSPNKFFQYIYRVGCAINLHSIINSGLTPGGQNLSNRQTVFFLLVDPMDKNHKRPDKIDLEAPRLAQYMHEAWKKHQNTVYWVDTKFAQKK